MADIPENYLLRAVDLLMSRISEQIMTLLEERARGRLAEAEFQARVRDLLGTISPEVVARHPGLPRWSRRRPRRSTRRTPSRRCCPVRTSRHGRWRPGADPLPEPDILPDSQPDPLPPPPAGHG